MASAHPPTDAEVLANARDGVATCRLCGWTWGLDGDLEGAYVVCTDCVPKLLDILATAPEVRP